MSPQTTPTESQQPFLTPEVISSRDENPPEIGANLATDKTLCEAVTKTVVYNYFIGYEMQQQRFWRVWAELDRAWRAELQLIDLNIPIRFYDQKTRDATASNGKEDNTMQISPTDLHKQWDALLKVIIQFSWESGVPVQAVVGNFVFETLYNPTTQTVGAINELIRDNADESNLQDEYRKNLAQFLIYGHCWGMADLKRTFEDVVHRYIIPPEQAQMAYEQLNAKYQGQTPAIRPLPDGSLEVTYTDRVIDEFCTRFVHLDKSDVFTDLMMTANIEKHPCPIVRRHIGQFAIEQNDYDPQTNPFGWVNTELAVKDNGFHYVLNEADEAPLREQLCRRFGLTDQGMLKAAVTIKQTWLAFPMLRVANGKLIPEEGITCPQCEGHRMVAPLMPDDPSMTIDAEPQDCPTCQGTGMARPKAERYVAEFYGNPRMGMTCLRIQKMPKKVRVPLIFAADMIEDTACLYPKSKGEVALNDLYVLAEGEALMLHSKRMAIHRGYKVKDGTEAATQDLDKPGIKILIESNPDEVTRIDSSTYDETITLAPYNQERRERIKTILGATDQILGMIEQGRRSAYELSTATDASKNPIIVTGDAYNRQMIGGWAQFLVENTDLFGDRDWIRRKTGREFLGKVRFHTAKAQEYVKNLALANTERTLLQTLPPLLPLMPELRPVVSKILQRFLNHSGMNEVIVPDDGLMEAQQEGMSIVNRILGDGAKLLPMPDDPDDLFIQLFTSAIRKIKMGEDYWSNKCDATLPMLEMRNEMQKQQAAFKAQQQFMLQMKQQLLMNPPEPQKGQAPGKADRSGSSPGAQIQSAQGAAGAAA